MSWSGVENIFKESLVLVNANPYELLRMTEAVLTTDEYEIMQELFSFCITWKRDSHFDEAWTVLGEK